MNMRLSAKSRYAVTAMVDLMIHGGARHVSLSEIAERQLMPLPYLEQLFARLRRAGLVVSSRGAMGGFALSRAAAQISLLEIIAAVDASIKTTGCGSDRPSCNGSTARCLTHDLWARLGHVVTGFFAQTMLADVSISGGEDCPHPDMPTVAVFARSAS